MSDPAISPSAVTNAGMGFESRPDTDAVLDSTDNYGCVDWYLYEAGADVLPTSAATQLSLTTH